jgi:hypothetical protein
MKGIPIMRLKPAKAGRLALLVGATVALAGASLLGATAAHAASAALGTGPGLTLTPNQGATTLLGQSITYNSPACPSGFQGSGILSAVNSDGSTYSVSGVNNSVAAAFSGTLATGISMAAVRDNGDIGPGGSQEIVVRCFAGASGAGATTNTVDTFVNWSADGNTWATGPAAPGAHPTAVSLTASPNPASTGANVTITAHVTVTDGSGAVPTGSVAFSVVGGSAIGTPQTLDATGAASVTTSFTNSGTVQVTAAYTSNATTTFANSNSSPFSENVTGPLSEPITVTVGPTGTFLVTVTSGTVTLAPNAAQTSATGTAQPVNILDTRNTFPGWSVSAQATDFTENTSAKPGSIPAANLGWTPTGTLTDATIGPVVAPGTTGLSAAQVWASALSGHGVTAATGDNVSASLLLNIPAGSPAATYNSALSISFTTSAA